LREVERFSKRPFMIVETGAEPGWARTVALESLFRGVANDRRMLGFVYFNQHGRRSWSIDGDPLALATYRKLSKRLKYGFAVR
jgi:mannan endo-1,4-beta-mannosidase